MDTAAEETFEGLTPAEVAKSALIGVVVLVGVIGAVKLVKHVRRVMKADDELWTADPIITPETES